MLKSDLKIWNKDVFRNVNQLGKVIQKKIQELDAHDDIDDQTRKIGKRGGLCQQNIIGS